MKKYKIKYQDENKIKELILETKNLLDEILPSNIIEIKELKNNFNFSFAKKINDKKMNLIFYELNIMLEANINLTTALNILIKNKKDKNIIDFLNILKHSILNAKETNKNLNGFKINPIIINFLEIMQHSDNTILNIKALSILLHEKYDLKINFLKAITYPIILIISFFFCLLSIFSFVIPKFKMIFNQIEQELPLATKILLNTQFIFENYFLIIILLLIIFFTFFMCLYLYNNKFNYYVDKFLIVKLVIIKDIYLNFELYKFFLMIDIMLKSNYEFHKAIISSKILLKNKYLLDRISLIDNLLQNGKSINESFVKTQLFDEIILNLINTGETSNSLNIIVDEIKKIYKKRFNEKINLFISLIQPTFLIFIMGLILWIVLAIFMPIWNMGTMIKV